MAPGNAAYHPSAQANNSTFFLIVSIVFFLLVGCSADTDYRPVDFSNTVMVEQPDRSNSETGVLRVAVAAMISPKETFVYYREMIDYLGRRLDRPVQLIQRKTYGEINELFLKGQVDLAYICTGPYAAGKYFYGFEGIATPVVRGKPFYQSYLLVHNLSSFRSLDELKGKTFAFTDPESNTGALVPTFWLSEIGETPASFFRTVNYTYSHDNSIMAVARNLVDGATVDGHKWEYYNKHNPVHTARTSVIRKSKPLGSPPLVAATQLPMVLKVDIKRVMHSMHTDPEGKTILEKLMIDRFTEPREEWYEPVRRMIALVNPKLDHALATQKP